MSIKRLLEELEELDEFEAKAGEIGGGSALLRSHGDEAREARVRLMQERVRTAPPGIH